MKKIVLFALLLGSMSISAQHAQTERAVKNVTKSVDVAADKVSKSFDNATNKTTKGIGGVYGDVKDGTKTVYTDAKNVIKDLSPDAKRLLVKIANKLEKTTDQVWDILVRQQKVWSICYLLLTISSIVLWFRFHSQFHIYKTDLNESGEVKDTNGVFALLLLVLALSASGFSSYHFVDMVTGFYNPEYGAMKNIYQVYKSVSWK